MDEKSKEEKFREIPETVQKEPVKKTELEKSLETFKSITGIEVEPVKNAKYKIERTIKYIESKYDFKFNIVTQEVEFKPKDKEAFQFFDNWEFNNLLNEIKLQNIVIGKDALKSLIESKQICTMYDPIKDYIFNLPNWDGNDHIKEFLQQISLHNEEERETLINTFKKWFTAMTASLIVDKVVNQWCFVLVGKQGIFKTTFLNSLVPKDLQENYRFSSKFNFDNKDHFKYLAMKMLINLDELASFSRADDEVLKTILSDDRVVVRLPYRAFDSKMWRKASFCGSANNKNFLKDETGSRRFLVFEIDNICIRPEFNLDLIYSQAFALFKDGYHYWFDNLETISVEKRNDEFHDVSIEQDLIQEYLEKPSKAELTADYGFHWKTTTSINNYLAGKCTKNNMNETTRKRVGMVMTKLGFIHKMKRMNKGEHPSRVWAVKFVENVTFENEGQQPGKNEEIF